MQVLLLKRTWSYQQAQRERSMVALGRHQQRHQHVQLLLLCLAAAPLCRPYRHPRLAQMSLLRHLAHTASQASSRGAFMSAVRRQQCEQLCWMFVHIIALLPWQVVRTEWQEFGPTKMRGSSLGSDPVEQERILNQQPGMPLLHVCSA